MRITRHPITDDDAWHRLRAEDVTASDVAALLGDGVHRYTTPKKIAADKRGESERLDNSVLRRGRVLEPAIAQALKEDHGIVVTRERYYLRLRSDQDPDLRIGATCDYHAFPWSHELAAALGEAMPLTWNDPAFPLHIAFEMKSVMFTAADRWASGLPAMHRIQALTQAMLSNATGAVVAALFDDHPLTLRLYPVPRDRAMEATIRRAVSAFWRREREGEDHPVYRRDNPAHTWPTSDPSKVLDLSRVDPLWHGVETWDDLLARREEARVAAKTAEAEKKRQTELADAIDHRLKIVMKDAEVAFTDKHKVTWKTGKRARTLRVREKTE